MSEIESGGCDVCGKKGDLERKYFYYDIKCECHSPKHFEIVYHCGECVPAPPKRTMVSMKTVQR